MRTRSVSRLFCALGPASSAIYDDTYIASPGALLVNFVQITPFMHVEDLERAVAFFRDLLGFQVLVRMGNYAYLHRETVGFRILESHGPEGAPPGNRRFCYYIDVRDVDALYGEWKMGELGSDRNGSAIARKSAAA